MTTAIHKKSIYGSDEVPNRKDREAAERLYSDEGTLSLQLIAEDAAMTRRKTAKNEKEITKVGDKLDKLTENVTDLTSAMIGDRFNEGYISETKRHNAIQLTHQIKTDRQLQRIIGVGVCMVVVCPIILGLVLAYMKLGVTP